MIELEKLVLDLKKMNSSYELQYEELQNSVAFILDVPRKKAIAIYRQIDFRNEVSIQIINKKVEVIANTIFLDFLQNDQNSHYQVIDRSNDITAEDMHSIIEAFMKDLKQKFKPSPALAKLVGETPKTKYWITEFVTCHLMKNNSVISNGRLRVDPLMAEILEKKVKEVDVDIFLDAVLKNIQNVTD